MRGLCAELSFQTISGSG